ncbi:MAG: hypothetical protein H6813_00915 [Phycisphaeraceae bacterium]|nr:hypothetical protein [Phycisphaeraceae bacterium]MCB9847353.1 hypothetical protein [Phycisphaeraceae bacterium]
MTADPGKPERAFPTRWGIYRRQLLFVLYSMLAGALFATSAMYSVMGGFGGDWIGGVAAGSAIGGTVGFILSPIFVGCLYRKPAGAVFALVVLPTWFLSFAGDPLAALVATTFCYIMMSAFGKTMLLDIWRHPTHCCLNCGYDLRGLPDGRPCPECASRSHLRAGPLDPEHPCQHCGFVNQTRFEIRFCPGCGAGRSSLIAEPDHRDADPAG